MVECLPRTCAKWISIFLGSFTLYNLSHLPFPSLLTLINQCTLALTRTKTVHHVHGCLKRSQNFACSPYVFASLQFDSDTLNFNKPFSTGQWSLVYFFSSLLCSVRTLLYIFLHTIALWAKVLPSTLVSSTEDISSLNYFTITQVTDRKLLQKNVKVIMYSKFCIWLWIKKFKYSIQVQET